MKLESSVSNGFTDSNLSIIHFNLVCIHPFMRSTAPNNYSCQLFTNSLYLIDSLN